MRDSKLFDDAVRLFFGPIAERLGLPLSKVKEGLYEIQSPQFIVCIRLDTGHARGLNVIVRSASLLQFNEDKSLEQYGIGNFIEFHGEQLEHTFIEIDTDEDFRKQVGLLAEATTRYFVPYLLGESTDFEAIKQAVQRKTEEALRQIESYTFLKNVRKQ